MGATTLLTSLVVIGIVLLFAYVLVRSRYKKAGPDEALIVYGRRKFFGKKVRGDKGEIEGFRIVRGGGTFVWPAWEQYEKLSLRMMTLDIDLSAWSLDGGVQFEFPAGATVPGVDYPLVVSDPVVFEDRADYRRFLTLLVCATRRGQIEVVAYSLMPNHFHLLVRSNGSLSEAMRRVNPPFTL